MAPVRVVVLALLVACPPEVEPVDPTVPAGPPTWHRDVAPIVVPACTACHRPGGINEALDFTTYEGIFPWKEAVRLATEVGSMPPFPADGSEACDLPWTFTNDQRLTDDQIATLSAWVAADAPLGDLATAAPVSDPVEETLDRVDQVLAPQEPFPVPSSDVAADPQICFLLDPGLTETGYLEGLHVIPEASSVVHHVRLNLTPRAAALDRAQEEGSTNGAWPCASADNAIPIGGYAPGMGPQRIPEGTGIRIEPDEVIVAWVHYHTVSEPVMDATQVQLQWAEETPGAEAYILKSDTATTEAKGLLPGPGDGNGVEFLIPAGSDDHTETFVLEVPDIGAEYYDVFSVLGHMHTVGVAFRMWVERADGSDGPCLLNIPRWDFDWQLFYGYDVAGSHPTVMPGDKIYVECTYDNTEGNPEVVQLLDENGLTEPVDVPYGTSSNAEMCSMLVGAIPR